MNQKWILYAALLAAMLMSACQGAALTQSPQTTPAQAGAAEIANPASQYCIESGGTLEIAQRGDGGEYGICYFEDNRQCEEWALMRGECPLGGLKITGYVTPAAQYCAITGGAYAITGDSNTDNEQGTCTLVDGTVCDVWDYYNGACTAGSALALVEPTVDMQSDAKPGLTIQPLIMEVCDGQAQAMAHALDVLEVTQSEEPLSDPISGASGAGCQAAAHGTGVQFESPSAVVATLGDMLSSQGWMVDPMLAADGPTGTGMGHRKENQICMANAIWFPDEAANCPKDQPISTCQVTPEQQFYTVTLNCGVEIAEGQALDDHSDDQDSRPTPFDAGITAAPATLIPLKDALGDLQPQQVFQNFYNITQIPRPFGHMQEIRQFMVDFGQGLGLETIVDDAGNVIIRKPAAAGYENRQGVILQAHMDMVPDKDSDVVFDPITDPIPVFVSGDYIVTQGTTLGADDGVGLAIIMALLQSKTLQAGPLEALFTVDEESTMSGAGGLKPDTLKGSFLINLDNEVEGTFTIGSAGGESARVNAAYTQTPAPVDMAAYSVKIQGLVGGHSGMDIDKGYGHATKLLVRLLKEAAGTFDLRLASLSGGTISNAIPREAEAIIFLDDTQVEAFTSFTGQYEATIQAELAATEPGLNVQVDAVQPPAQVMDESFQDPLINALYGTPQGVFRMSDTVPGLVETSTNLGITNVQDGQLEAGSYLRSSVNSQLQDIAQMTSSVWELAGYPVEISGWYSAWTPNPDSAIVELMQTTYQDLFGQPATINAVHAGLECGTFVGTYPEMDMISIGPTMEKVHSPSERLYIPSVEKVMILLAEVLQRLPEQ